MRVIMFFNYLKIALRMFNRQKAFSFSAVASLSVGIATVVLIVMFARNELAVDNVFSNTERVVRVNSIWREESMGLPQTTLAPIGPGLKATIPEIEDQVRLYYMTGTLHLGNENLRKNVISVDPSFIDVFDLPLIAGNIRSLETPRSMVISEELAVTLFGSPEVLGRIVGVDTWSGTKVDFTVTAVFKKLPLNSITHYSGSVYDVIIPFGVAGDFVAAGALDSWQNRFMMTFIKLSEASQLKDVEEKLTSFLASNGPPEIQGNLHLTLHQLRTLHLSENDGFIGKALSLLAGVAVLILLLAIMNFVNIMTARSLSRGKEIAMRKVAGATRTQLIGQSLLEALVISFIATLIGASCAEIAFEPFLRAMATQVVLTPRWDGAGLLIVGAIAVGTGILAGSYPGFVISSFKPVKALKGSLQFSPATATLRSGLVVAQFSIAIVLAVAILTMADQFTLLTNKDLGFQKENILIIESVPRIWSPEGVRKMRTVRQEIERLPGVLAASLSYDTPTGDGGNTWSIRRTDQSQDAAVDMVTYSVDEMFPTTYGLTMREGRFFTSLAASDSDAIVLNVTAARDLGLTSAVGSTVVGRNGRSAKVIGVLEDFHYESLHRSLRPMFFSKVDGALLFRKFSIRLSASNVPETLERIRETWRTLLPDAPFEYSFVEDQINGFYRSDRALHGMVTVASGIALLIACTGIFGLASYSIQRRTKEVGIRKVMGATVPAIVGLISRALLKLVLIANVIAWPIAYLAMNRWLEDFAYRVEMGWWLFATAGGVALFIALITVSFQAVRAALANPVEALRYE